MYPGRKNALFTEEGIRAAIQSGLEDIEAGRRPAVIYRPPYRPYKRHPKYTGFMALNVHYLYVLGKIGQRQYPPRMTPQLRQEVMKSQRYREQFDFLRENGIATQGDMAAFQSRTEDALATLTKQRTILNVRKKKRKRLYNALTDVSALAQAKQLYEDGLSGMEAEVARYMEAVAVLEECSIPRERLTAEKAETYEQVAEATGRSVRNGKRLALCRDILDRLPQMEHDINKIEEHTKEVERDERRRR